MKRTDIRIGTKVKVIDARTKKPVKDSPIYTVEKWLDSWTVELSYTENSRKYTGGKMDISLLKKHK